MDTHTAVMERRRKPEAGTEAAFDKETLGQVVLVFQGGGALGAYQAGVYEAMQEVGLEPDWVIGTSIGAINASLIAGNPPGKRLARLQEFWRRIEHGPFRQMAAAAWGAGSHGGQHHDDGRRSGRLLPAQPLGLHGDEDGFGRRERRLLLDGAAGEDADRPDRPRLPERRRAKADGGRRQRPERRDALFRQPQGPPDDPPCDGFRRPSPRLPRDPDRRRALLGWRHPVEHPGRSGVRRQSPAERRRLHGPYLEPQRAGAGQHLEGHEPPEGPSIFKPRRQPHRPPEADPPPAPRHRRTGGKAARRTSGTTPKSASCRPMAA